MKPTVKKPSIQEKEEACNWPIWEKEISEFPWEYDENETCYFLEGKVEVTNEEGETFRFGRGDYVVLPKGMKCTWKINENVRKHYKLG